VQEKGGDSKEADEENEETKKMRMEFERLEFE